MKTLTLFCLLIFISLVLANEDILRLFRSRRNVFKAQKRAVFPGDDKLKDLVPQFSRSSTRHTFSVKGLVTSSATISLAYDIVSSYSFRYLESINGVQDVAFDDEGLYVLFEDRSVLSELLEDKVVLTTQMDWRSGMKPEHTFHNRLPTGKPAHLLASNVVFIPAKEVNIFDVASSAKIDFVLLPHASHDDLKRTTLDDTQSTNLFSWNYDPTTDGSKGPLQVGTSFKCIDCYVYTRFSIIFNLDYGPVSLNPIPKLNSLKVSFQGDMYGKYAVVLGPGQIQAFNQPAVMPTFLFSTMTVGTFPVTFSGNMGIQFVSPTLTGLQLRANNTFQASAQIGYQYTTTGTVINTFTPSTQYSNPRFTITSPVPGTFEVHVIPGIIAKFPSSTVNFDMTYQFDPWVAIDLYPKNDSLCSAGGSAYTVSSGYKMTVTSGGMTYQGTYIMPKIGPLNFPPAPVKKPADCSFCRGCTTPSSTPGSIQASTRKRNTVLRADGEVTEYSTWYKINTSPSPVQISLKGSAFKDSEEIANVIIYIGDDSETVNVQIYADQGRKPTPDNFKWSATNQTSSQQLEIPVDELDSSMNLNIAFTSDQPIMSDFIVFLDIQIGERYGKVFRMGDLPDSGMNTISFESDSSGPALGGFVVVVGSAESGSVDAQITTNTTEGDVWWQGGNDGNYQNVWMYLWQINDDPDWSWEDEYIDDSGVLYSGYVSASEPSTNVTVMVAPFVEITLLNWYAFLESKSIRFYFLTAVDPEVDELWIQYDNSDSASDLMVSHKAFSLNDEISMKKNGDVVAKGETKDFKFKKGKFDGNDYILGTAYSEQGSIDVGVAVYFIYPLTSGIPEVENDVNATFSIYRFDLVDIEKFPGRGGKCSAFFTEQPPGVSMLLNFENLETYDAEAFTTSDGITWEFTIKPEHATPAYVYIEAVNGSSFSVICTHVIPLPSASFEIEAESLSTIIFDLTGAEDRYLKFPSSSLLHLHPTADENVYLRPVDRDVGISKGFSYLTFSSTVADLDERERSIEIQPLNETVDVEFKVRDNLMNVSLSNYQYQWNYDYLLKDLSTTLRTFQGGQNWDNYVARVLEDPATYLLNNTNNQRLCFDISTLKRPTKLTVTVPTQWTIPPLDSEENASKKIQ